MTILELFELSSYIVTIIGLPLAISIFIYEQRKERENEEEECYLLLSDAYHKFLQLVLANPDLRLRTQVATPDLTAEQEERVQVIFDILISLFERAYLTSYSETMTPRQARRWHSWDDFMREWCRRGDFRDHLPRLLQGEDEDFARYLRQVEQEELEKMQQGQ